MKKKEECSKCGGSNYVVATDNSNKHYCQVKGCKHVWVPGLEDLKRPDVVLKQAQDENVKLRSEIDRLRKENAHLKATIKNAEKELFE